MNNQYWHTLLLSMPPAHKNGVRLSAIYSFVRRARYVGLISVLITVLMLFWLHKQSTFTAHLSPGPHLEVQRVEKLSHRRTTQWNTESVHTTMLTWAASPRNESLLGVRTAKLASDVQKIHDFAIKVLGHTDWPDQCKGPHGIPQARPVPEFDLTRYVSTVYSRVFLSKLKLAVRVETWHRSNNNNNRIQRRYSRFFFFTVSSQRRELSPTRTLKWPRRNRVQITCNTSSAYHVQVSCYVPLGTKGQLSYSV